MAELNMKSVVKRYNKLMFSIAREHVSIGTEFSEDTEDWNLRDLVSEAQFQYDNYFEGGTVQCAALLGEYGPEDKAAARAEMMRLKRFVDNYGPHCNGLVCAQGHCSKWDNHKFGG